MVPLSQTWIAQIRISLLLHLRIGTTVSYSHWRFQSFRSCSIDEENPFLMWKKKPITSTVCRSLQCMGASGKLANKNNDVSSSLLKSQTKYLFHKRGNNHNKLLFIFFFTVAETKILQRICLKLLHTVIINWFNFCSKLYQARELKAKWEGCMENVS